MFVRRIVRVSNETELDKRTMNNLSERKLQAVRREQQGEAQAGLDGEREESAEALLSGAVSFLSKL